MATTPEGTPARRLAVLAIQAGPRIGEELPVTAPRVTIGSGSQSDLVIADDSISTSHALLEYELGGWRLTDLDSTNGSWVEGVKLAPQVPTPLPYGSSLRFGGVRMHFRGVADADPEAARAAYTPAAQEPTLAERRTGFRLPVWVLLAVLLVVVVVAVAIFAWMQPPTTPTTPAPQVEQVAPATPAPAAPVAPAGAPLATDTVVTDTVVPQDVDTLAPSPPEDTP